MRFENKVVIVTGAGSGIGAATAELFAKEGANVVAVDLDEDALREVVERCNDPLNGSNTENNDSKLNGNVTNSNKMHTSNVIDDATKLTNYAHSPDATHGDIYNGNTVHKDTIMIVANVAKDDDIKRIIEETIRTFDKLDVLVNCAGIYRDGTIIDGSVLETYDDVLNVNLRAVVQLTTLAAPHLMKTKGNVINISSIKAMAISTSYAYDISKVGIEHFTRRAALEFGQFGVRVNAVRPGPVRTGIIKNAGLDIDIEGWTAMTALDRMSDPEEIAEHILFLASAKGVTGSVFTHDNGTLVKYCAF